MKIEILQQTKRNNNSIANFGVRSTAALYRWYLHMQLNELTHRRRLDILLFCLCNTGIQSCISPNLWNCFLLFVDYWQFDCCCCCCRCCVLCDYIARFCLCLGIFTGQISMNVVCALCMRANICVSGTKYYIYFFFVAWYDGLQCHLIKGLERDQFIDNYCVCTCRSVLCI